MACCTLVFPEYERPDTTDSNPKRGNKIDIYTASYIYKWACTMKRRPQDITDNIYLNENKCNTLTENGGIKKRWSEYYSEMLNETNRTGNC